MYGFQRESYRPNASGSLAPDIATPILAPVSLPLARCREDIDAHF